MRAMSNTTIATALLGVATALITAPGCGRRQHPGSPPVAPPAVTVAEVRKDSVPIIMELNGTVQAIKSVDIVPRVSGYVDKRPFVEGTFVKKGDLLYEIDQRPFEAKLHEYEGDLDANQANVNFQQSEVDRVEEAAAQGAASSNEVLRYKKDLAAAQGDLQRTQGLIEATKLDLTFCKVTAPFDGRIQNTNINVGSVVTAQETALTTLVQIDPIYVYFNLSRRQAYQIQQLQAEGLTPRPIVNAVKARLILPNEAVYPYEGTVDFVSAEIDPGTDSFGARLIVPNPFKDVHDAILIPGQYIPVHLVLGERSGCLVIPDRAVVHTQQGSRVYVVGDGDTVEGRNVELGPVYRGDRVILKGLAVGERVIVEGTQKVHPGITVKPAASTATPSAAG
jgi:RND family efflux transporter MFP subunit